MENPRKHIEFLERSSYRQRRMRDAARLLPVLAGVLMLLPLLWPRSAPDDSLTSTGMMYLFGLWLILVLLAFGLSRVLNFSDARDEVEPPKQDLPQ